MLWGARWDPLLARDTLGLLRKRMEECVDGEYQVFKARGGAFTREHFFGKYQELKDMIADLVRRSWRRSSNRRRRRSATVSRRPTVTRAAARMA